MKIRANLLYEPGPFLMDSCQIEKILELSARDFSILVANPLCNWPCIVENRSHMFTGGGVVHCLLALEKGSADGVLINSEGPAHRLRAAYVPGMRDIVNAELDRAADFIVRQNTRKRKTVNTCWCAYLEDLEEHLGLTIREGSGTGHGTDDVIMEEINGQYQTACAFYRTESRTLRQCY